MSSTRAESDPRVGTGQSVIICLVVVVVAIGAAVLGTMSTFSTAITKTQNASTGTFTFTLNDPGSGAVFATDISGMAPGDFADRLVNLSNTGAINFSSVGIAVAAPSTSSALDSDAVNGLQLQIAKCSVAWTQSSNTAAATCSGTTTVLTASTAVATLKSSGPSYTSGLTCLTSGSDYLRFHYSLPTGSTGTAGLSSSIEYTFTATQAAGGAYH